MTNKGVTFLASLGAGFEYYDFVIYGLLATYLSQAFFSTTHPIVGIMQAFGVFAVGYFVRPIGGIIFGSIADRFGRKKTFLLSILLMAFATVAIGLLPTVQQWGIIATCLLIFLRIVQGFAYGADLPGATTFLVEHVNKNKRGVHCGFALSSVGIGAMISSLTIYILLQILTPQQMHHWGWRIPFWIGGGLAIVGYFMRKKLYETPLFERRKHLAQKNQPLIELFKYYPKQIAIGIGMSLFTACFIVFGVGLPTYLHQFYAFQTDAIYFYLTLGYIWSALLLPIFGYISDQVGRSRMLLWTSSVVVLCFYFLFQLLNYHSNFTLALFIIIYETFVAALVGSYSALFAELFPTSVRFSGVAFCYNIVFSIASLTPAFVTRLAVSGEYAVISFFILLACSTVLITALMQNQVQPELE